MPNNIVAEVNEFLVFVKKYFGENLKSVIVYGSYARGDYHENSDLDIMILVNYNDEKIKSIENDIYDFSYDLELKYGITFSPIIKNHEFFDYWSDTLPFYRNIKEEGVRVA